MSAAKKMGKMFLEHPGGTRLYTCAKCSTVLTNRANLLSTRFTGSTGRAFLFKKVVNLVMSEKQDRVMLTGRHIVRDVSCKKCKVCGLLCLLFISLIVYRNCNMIFCYLP